MVLLFASSWMSVAASGGPVGLLTTVAMMAICGLLFATLLVLAPRWLHLPALLLLLASTT